MVLANVSVYTLGDADMTDTHCLLTFHVSRSNINTATGVSSVLTGSLVGSDLRKSQKLTALIPGS